MPDDVNVGDHEADGGAEEHDGRDASASADQDGSGDSQGAQALDGGIYGALAKAAADRENLLPPVVDQLSGLMPLIESVDALARQAERAAEVMSWVRAEDLRAVQSLADVFKALDMRTTAAAKLGEANLLAVNLRGLDQLTAFSELYRQHAVTARWAERTMGFSALTTWRVALQANSRIEQLHLSVTSAVQSYNSELLRIGRIYVGLADWVVQQDAASRLLGELSGKPLARWRDYIGTLPPEPSAWDLRVAVLSGRAGLGVLGADLLTSGTEDVGLVEAGSARVETDVLAPWEEGRLELGRALRKRLGEIDPSVPELLEGAWHEVKWPSPAAVSKAANCAIEVLDRTLRAAAPEAAVREWHQRLGRPAAEWKNQQRPPQSLRVRFLAQKLGGAEKVAVVQYESLARLPQALRGELQASKHASRGGLVAVQSLLVAIEDLLALLLLPGDERES